MKRLVYYFYYNPSDDSNLMYRINFLCLSRYLKLFDDVQFFISLDDMENRDIIAKIEQKFINIEHKGNISFKIVPNTYYREAKVFYDEIASKLGEYEGLTFFAHNKGTTNNQNENVFYWLTSLYFFNLETIDEVEKKLFDNGAIAYGNPCVIGNEDEIKIQKHPWGISVGTFFWLHEKQLATAINNNGIIIPKLDSRFYAEDFVSNMFPLYYKIEYYYSHGVNFNNFYGEGKWYIEQLYSNSPLWDKYLIFYNEILTEAQRTSNFLEI